jgi:hypothetical protein
MRINKLLLILLLSAGLSRAEGVFSDLKATAALDMVSPVYNSAEKTPLLNMRGAELMFYSPVDHLFDGQLNFAGHTEGGEFFWELHEAYLGSSKLLPRSRFRIGKFFLGVGRLNQIHQHDWPFISAPKAHERFFADEGAADVGLEYTYLLPTENFIEITAGVTNGYCYGHCHGAGQRPPRPLTYLHPSIFFEGDTGGTLLGLSYLNRSETGGVTTHLVGLDLTHKRRAAKVLRWLHQVELYYERQGGDHVETEHELGGYYLAQNGLDENWSTGLRLDAFSHLNKKFQSTGERRGDLDFALVPMITYKSSEFATLRLAYTFSVDTTEGDADRRDHLVELQYSFILGAHPAHDF